VEVFVSSAGQGPPIQAEMNFSELEEVI